MVERLQQTRGARKTPRRPAQQMAGWFLIQEGDDEGRPCARHCQGQNRKVTADLSPDVVHLCSRRLSESSVGNKKLQPHLTHG
jgi:hypothetical protein